MKKKEKIIKKNKMIRAWGLFRNGSKFPFKLEYCELDAKIEQILASENNPIEYKPIRLIIYEN